MTKFKRFWDNYAGMGHVLGWAVMIVFIGGVKWAGVESQAATIDKHQVELDDHEKRLKMLENSEGRVEQKLDDLLMFWHVPHHGN